MSRKEVEYSGPPWWFWACLGFVVFGLMLFVFSGCGGSDSGELFSPLPISPMTDGGLSEGPLTGSDGARDPGLDATVVGEFRGEEVEAIPPVDGLPDELSHVDASYPRDVTQDSWPVDVVVERMPAPNCFVDFAGNWSCCFARNQPPVDCEHQNMPHYCDSCPK